MRKLLLILIAMVAIAPAFSQTVTKVEKKKFNLANRAGDHLMVQLSVDSWTGAPDSIKSHIKGFSKGANFYLMLDKPFKGNERLSLGIGVGIGTSNMGFKKMIVDIAASSPKLPFIAVDTLNQFKKYKLASTYLEVPLELRYTTNPETPGKTFKAALGIKVGTLLKAQTKGKNLQNASGQTINGFTQKESSKSYFNTTRIAATARVAYGYFGLFGSYNLSSMFKNGVAANMNLLQIGLSITGL